MWYVTLNIPSELERGPLYLSVKQDRWVGLRRVATYWRKRENAERVASEFVMKKPEHIGLVEVVWAKLQGYGG